VSNPPYFQASLKNPDQARATARHTDSLSYGELIRHAARLLSEHGTLALILPAESEQEIIALAKEQDLYPTHLTYVHPKPGKEAKRILIAFSHSTPYTLHSTPYINSSPESGEVPAGRRGLSTLSPSHLYIESASSPRSEEYQELTKDFYL
jgi:tRNA1Val (adenine37-N6)-methyltransferase